MWKLRWRVPNKYLRTYVSAVPSQFLIRHLRAEWAFPMTRFRFLNGGEPHTVRIVIAYAAPVPFFSLIFTFICEFNASQRLGNFVLDELYLAVHKTQSHAMNLCSFCLCPYPVPSLTAYSGDPGVHRILGERNPIKIKCSDVITHRRGNLIKTR